MTIPEHISHEVKVLRAKALADEAAAKAKITQADDLVKKLRAEGQDPQSADNFAQVDAAYKEGDALREGAAEAQRQADRYVAAHAHDVADRRDVTDVDDPEVRQAARLSWGAQFVASDEYKHLAASGALEMKGARVGTSPIQVATRDEVVARFFPHAVHLAAVNVTPLIPVDQTLIPPIFLPQRALRARDLVTVNTTDTDTIEYTEETVSTDAAVETPYGTAAPESTYTYVLRTALVRRIPHFVPVGKGNLADQSQLTSLINNKLVRGVEKRLDTQIVNGNGVGDNLLGVLNTAGIGTLSGATGTLADNLHKILTIVRIANEGDPTAFGISPVDMEKFVLLKDTVGNYLHTQGPQSATPPTIWGLPAVVSTNFAAGVAVVGDWSAAELWIRSGVAVAASDSHSDYFLRGLVAMLAEMRAAFAVTQPKAFATLTAIP